MGFQYDSMIIRKWFTFLATLWIGRMIMERRSDLLTYLQYICGRGFMPMDCLQLIK